MDIGSLLSALALGLVCGVFARILTPGDFFRNMSGLTSWLVSIGLGLLGALLGYWFFTVVLGIGDEDVFDWGGLLGALIGTIVVVVIGSWLLRKFSKGSQTPSGPSA